MRSITLLSAVAAASLSGALAQTTADIVQLGFLGTDDQLQGEIVGVGAEGTTYVVTNVVTDPSDDVAFTETIVQDATHASLVLAISLDPSNAVSVNAVCTYASLDPTVTELPGDCVGVEQDVESGVTSITTASDSGTLIVVPAAVSTASGVKATGASGSGSGSSSGLKTTNSPTAGSTVSGSSASPTTTSGAMAVKIGAASIVALPVISMLVFLL